MLFIMVDTSSQFTAMMRKIKGEKKFKKGKPAAEGVLVVDRDPIWQKPVKLEEEEEEEDSAGINRIQHFPGIEEKPEVDERSRSFDVRRPKF